MKFKKIMSVLASAAMLSSTIAFAAAANLYPKPFTDGAAIVYASNADSSDLAGAIDIYDQLKTRVGGATDANVIGDAKAVETASQLLYLGDYLNTTKATFTKDQLPVVLADDTVTDDSGKEFDVQLKLDVLKSRVLFGDTPDNLDEPVIFVDTNNNKRTYALRIVFPTAANMSQLTDEGINLFGKNYIFSGNVADLGSSASVRRQAILFEKATLTLSFSA